MGHRRCKKMRKLVYGTGAEAQLKKHNTEYIEKNGSRPRLVELTYNEPKEVQNCFFQTLSVIKEVFVKTFFWPDGTRECTGLRRIYKTLKNGV